MREPPPCVVCDRSPEAVLQWGRCEPIRYIERHDPDCPLGPAVPAQDQGR